MLEVVKKDLETRKDIEFLIDSFYVKVKADREIGHFFNKVVELNWDVHIPVMYDFWDSILLGSGTYHGNPMLKHVALNQKSKISDKHFGRWLHLWKETVTAHFEGDTSNQAIDRAKQIAELMKHKISEPI